MLAVFIAADTVSFASLSRGVHREELRVPGEKLKIRQLDVGQGDAALITTPEGKRILIDAGPNPGQVARMLVQEGIDTIDLVIASHNHADHIGGMPEVLSRTVVRAYLENGVPHTTSTYRRTLAALEREPGLRYLNATARTITLGSVTLRVLPPPRLDMSQNNNSVGIVIEYGEFRALYTGDSERSELRAWLRQGIIPKVTFLKIPHHGSFTGTTTALTRATAPKIVALSVGASNSYGHPSPHALYHWRVAGSRLFRTDRDGTFEVQASRNGEFLIRSRALSQREGGK